ncbi:F-box/FBD/LRR-repeat protein At1g13570-like [Tasmannia lanceolata]|uniref:F-box/FBD/LRR-repeat protein At1g13570-like n=1 Tax=Tasmannia lanceolata TaxID=3420 RepID=UPI0040632085
MAGNEDRISKLPDHLLGSILSLLPMKEAARASLLSKRCRYLLTSLPQLVLDYRLLPATSSHGFGTKEIDKWVGIVDQILSLHNHESIQNCEIGPIVLDQCHSDLDRFLSFLTMKGIQRLVLNNALSMKHYKIPNSVFCCGSLRELELNNCILNSVSSFKGLRQLESLKLYYVEVSEDMVAKLVSSCNLLKELRLWYCPIKNFEIEIHNLLRLDIRSYRPLNIRQKNAISNFNNPEEEDTVLRYAAKVNYSHKFRHIGVGHFIISI